MLNQINLVQGLTGSTINCWDSVFRLEQLTLGGFSAGASSFHALCFSKVLFRLEDVDSAVSRV